MILAKRHLLGVAALAAVAAISVPGIALAAGGPPTGKGHGSGRGGGIGGGGGGETTAANNLSIPTIFVGTNPFGLTCSSGPTDPGGDPSTGYPITRSNYYYVQGLNRWQAQCATTVPPATVAGTVTVDWGDNLVGEGAALMVGHPIRVEVALKGLASTPMTGYTVQKLDPNALDRESAYGVLAMATAATGGFTVASSKKVSTTTPGVWDQGAKWDIRLTGSATPVVTGAASAEINATGRVVYGHNLRVQTPGTYVITFTAPNVTLKSTNGTVTGSTATITIHVTAGGGGGNGNGHRTR